MDWKDRVITDPKILGGKPCIKDTRMAVELVLELIAQGRPESEILRNYPDITHEDIKACLQYAKSLIA